MNDLTYFGYNPSKIKVGDVVVSFPHHRTKSRLHGDVVDINPDTNTLTVNYNRTEMVDGSIIERGIGIKLLQLNSGTLYCSALSTSLDAELILRKEE